MTSYRRAQEWAEALTGQLYNAGLVCAEDIQDVHVKVLHAIEAAIKEDRAERSEERNPE